MSCDADTSYNSLRLALQKISTCSLTHDVSSLEDDNINRLAWVLYARGLPVNYTLLHISTFVLLSCYIYQHQQNTVHYISFLIRQLESLIANGNKIKKIKKATLSEQFHNRKKKQN
jgi:hypothetical protein